MGWKLKHRCVRAAPPKKWPFLAQKWPKSANFGQKGSVFGLGCSVQDPRTLFFRCLTQKTMFCMVLKSQIGVSGPPHPKHGHFLPQNGLKMPILGLKHRCFGLRRSDQGPPTLFCRCLTQKNIGCKVWTPENRYFRAAPPKEWPFFGLKLPILGPIGAFSGLCAQIKAPLCYGLYAHFGAQGCVF